MAKNYSFSGRDILVPENKHSTAALRTPAFWRMFCSWRLLLITFVLGGQAAWSQIALPYFENFSTISADGGFPTVTGGAWTRQGNATNQPTYAANPGSYNRSGNGDGKFIAFQYNSGTRSYFVGPFALTGGVSYTASALYKADGLTGFGPLDLRYGTTAAAATQTNVIATVPSNITNLNFQLISGAFTPASTGNYFLSIRSQQNGNPWYLTIDDFKLEVTPACVAPTNAVAIGASSTTANVSWSGTVPSNGFEYAITTSATPPASGATAMSNSVSGVSGLSASTAYYLHVRRNCGVDGFSEWATSPQFTTPCAETSTLPYVQDFSSATVPALPACTRTQNVGSGNNWTTASTVYDGLFPASQGNYLRYLYNSANAANTWFFTRGINLEAGTAYRIKYKYGNDGGTTYPERMKVAYGPNPIASAMTTVLADYPSIVTTNNNAEVYFTPSTTGAFYFGFQCYSAADQNLLQLDDIVVELAPACLAPTGLAAANITFTSADLSWTAPSPAPADGYEWAVSTSATPPASGTFTAGTSVPSGTLASETVHYLHVRSQCGEDDFSEWATSTFYTGHCLSTANSPDEAYNLEFVTTNGYTNISNASTYSANGYSDFTSMSVSEEPEGTVDFSVSPSTGTLYYYGLGIFADFNNDLDFDDAGEQLYASPEDNFDDPLTGSFTVPAGVVPGSYRLRVKMDFINADAVPACGNAAVSDTEDYTLTVVPVQTCFPVASISTSNLSSTGVTLTWPAVTPAPAEGYEWAVTTSATPPASGTVTAGTSETVGSLSANTQYYAHVRSVCAAGSDESLWFSYGFRTLCDPFTALPYSQGFEAASTPECWTAEATSGAGFQVYEAISTEVPAAHTGNTFMGIAWSSDVSQNGVLLSPGFDLTAAPTRQARINVWVYRNTSGLATDQITFGVNDERTADGAETLLSVAHPGATAGWQNFTVDIPTSYNSSVFYVIVTGAITTSFSSYSIGFDDLTVEFAPPAVTSFSPETICSSDLATSVVTLTGTNFVGVTSVELNGESTPFTVINDTTIEVNLTAGSTAGSFTVNADGSGTSASSLVINASPVVEPIQNGDATICAGETVDLETASPGGTWSSSDDSVATVDASGVVTAMGAGSATISYTVVDNGCSTSVSTNVAVNAAVASSNPLPQTVITGDDATFSVTATGATAYQWQVSMDGGDTFSDVAEEAPYSGTNTSTLLISATPDTLNEYMYRVVISGNAPCADYETASATLNVGDTGISAHPQNVTQCSTALGDATFSVTATGTVDTYEWQEDQGLGFNPISDGTVGSITYSGASTNQLMVSGLSAANSGYAYRAVVVGPANSAVSNAASFIVNQGVSITSEPSAASVCYSGGSAVFTAAASGTVSGYAWQYSADNVNFSNVANGTPAGASYSGASTASLTVTTTAATPSAGTYFYRMVANGTGSCPSAQSTGAQLMITSPAITAQPAASSVQNGLSTTFSVATSAPSATYQWQYAATSGGPWNNVANGTPAAFTYSGATTATLTVGAGNAATSSSARWYRAIVTSAGCSVNSNAAQLTVTSYCVPAPSSQDNSGITNVTIGTINNTTGSESGYYGNYANLSTNVQQLTTVPFSIQYSTGYSYDTTIWIDWNNSGSFTSDEIVYQGTSTSSNPTTLSGTINIPLSAPIGPHRMRIGGVDEGPLTAPCYTGEYGTFEDYTVNVIAAPACAGTPTAGTASSNVAAVCGSGSVTLSASGYTQGVTGISMQWHNTATGPISGATNPTYTTPVLSSAASYFLRVTCANGGAFADSNTVTIGITNPSVTSTTPGTRCGTGTVDLSATGSAGTTLNWYGSATGGALLYTGSSFTTPAIASTTTFYVEANEGGTSGYAGPTGNATSTNDTNVGSHGVAITTTVANVKINNIRVPFTGTGTITFALKNTDNTTVISSFTTGSVTGTGLTPLSIPVNMTVATPGNYILVINAITGSIDDLGYGTGTFPYTALGGGFSVTSGYWYGTTGDLLYIYGVNVSTGCPSARTAVVATVTAPDALTLDSNAASICNGASTAPVMITSNVGNYDSYTWSPSTGVSGNAASGWTFNPTATTAYTLTASSTESGCANTATYTVTVNSLPQAFTVASAQVCSEGAPVQLTASFASNATTGCLEDGNGQYPSGEFSSEVCDGVTSNVITTNAWAGEYSAVAVSANTKYVFTSSGAGDMVTISDSEGGSVYAYGPSPLTYVSQADESVRFYSQIASCETENAARARTFTCEPLPSFVWSPSAGLFTDAAGTVPYNGGNAVSVYAKPTSTQAYVVTATNGAGCTRVANTTVTVNTATAWYVDADNDNYGDSSLPTIMACEEPALYAAVGGDCDDTLAAVNPGQAEVYYNGVDDNCDGNLDEGNQLVSQVLPAECGTTLTAINSLIRAVSFGAPVNGYRFKVVNMTTNEEQTIDRTAPHFTLTQLAAYDYATTYSISVMLRRNGIWLGYYGPSCMISTPAILDPGGAAAVNPSQCGIVLPSISTLIATTSLNGVTAYRFRVTNLTDGSAPFAEQVIERNLHWFSLTMLSRYNYGTEYQVEVAVKTANGTWSGYGAPCNVTSPGVPTLTTCGAIATSANTNITTTSLNRVTAYRFEVTDLTTFEQIIIDRSLHWFRFSNVPNYVPGATYGVRVSVQTAGYWSPFGEICEVTAPGAARGLVKGEEAPFTIDFRAVAYPNPYIESFALDMDTSSEEKVQVKVYDMVGKLLEDREFPIDAIEMQQFGERYPSGVYNLVVTQAGYVKTLRVIKR